MARIVVLGAAGLIGRSVSKALRSDHEVLCVDREPRSVTGWHAIDVTSEGSTALRRLLEAVRPAAIVNCIGALSGTQAQLVRSNVLTVARLLDALPSASGSVRLVHIGSAAEYGAPPERVPVDEGCTPRPHSAYGISKLAGSQLVLAARNQGGIEAVVLRVFNPVGPGLPDTTLPGRAAESMRRALRDGHNAIRLGTLDAYRDYVDVRDIAAAVAAAVERPSAPPELINVGSGTAVQARMLVHQLGRISGFGGTVQEEGATSRRSESVAWIAADITLAARALGWLPRYSLAQSLHAQWEADVR